MKIIITGDVLRPDDSGLSHQKSNIQWFYNLMNWQISQTLINDKVELLLWDEGKDSFDAKSFYQLNNLDISTESWAKLFSATVEDLTKDSIEYFRNFFKGVVAVVGFELPEVFLRLFNKYGIVYIDFITHPVRFLDDIFFGIRTNSTTAFEYLKNITISEEQFYVQANIHKATISRISQPELEKNSCLLVGQTKADRSLICDGTILTLLDYIDKLDEIAHTCSRIYYKPHPHAWQKDDAAQAVQKRSYIEVIHDNIYKLLCHESIYKVVSISSSVIYESRFFEKEGNYLYKNSLNLYDQENAQFNPWVVVPVYDDFYNPSFWSDMLAGCCRVNNCANITLPHKTSRLRMTCQTYWGYNFLDFDLLHRTVEQNILTTASEMACNKVLGSLKDLQTQLYGKRGCFQKSILFLKKIRDKIMRLLVKLRKPKELQTGRKK